MVEGQRSSAQDLPLTISIAACRAFAAIDIAVCWLCDDVYLAALLARLRAALWLINWSRRYLARCAGGWIGPCAGLAGAVVGKRVLGRRAGLLFVFGGKSFAQAHHQAIRRVRPGQQ